MSFDQVMIRCGAPALCGIKSASLFSMNMNIYGSGIQKLHELTQYFAKQGIFILPIQKDNSRILFFVYNKVLLEKMCSQSDSKTYLIKKGYPVKKGIDSVIVELVMRLSASDSETFPHEVGLFLGYPLEDVIQFEKQAGEGFKYSGYWKVYGNISGAMEQMALYKQCSSYCESLLSCGMSIPKVAKKYKTVKVG